MFLTPDNQASALMRENKSAKVRRECERARERESESEKVRKEVGVQFRMKGVLFDYGAWPACVVTVAYQCLGARLLAG